MCGGGRRCRSIKLPVAGGESQSNRADCPRLGVFGGLASGVCNRASCKGGTTHVAPTTQQRAQGGSRTYLQGLADRGVQRLAVHAAAPADVVVVVAVAAVVVLLHRLQLGIRPRLLRLGLGHERLLLLLLLLLVELLVARLFDGQERHGDRCLQARRELEVLVQVAGVVVAVGAGPVHQLADRPAIGAQPALAVARCAPQLLPVAVPVEEHHHVLPSGERARQLVAVARSRLAAVLVPRLCECRRDCARQPLAQRLLIQMDVHLAVRSPGPAGGTRAVLCAGGLRWAVASCGAGGRFMSRWMGIVLFISRPLANPGQFWIKGTDACL